MLKNIGKWTAIRLGLLILMLLLLALVWPLGFIKTEYRSESLEKGMAVSGSITQEQKLLEAFTPLREGLETIGIRVSIPNVEEKTGILKFELLTEDRVIYTEDVEIAGIKNNSYLEFSPGMELAKDETYYYQLSAYDYGENPPSVYLGSKDTTSGEHMKLFYSGEEFDNNAPILQYSYRDKVGRVPALPYMIVIAGLFGLIFAALPEEVTDDENN